MLHVLHQRSSDRNSVSVKRSCLLSCVLAHNCCLETKVREKTSRSLDSLWKWRYLKNVGSKRRNAPKRSGYRLKQRTTAEVCRRPCYNQRNYNFFEHLESHTDNGECLIHVLDRPYNNYLNISKTKFACLKYNRLACKQYVLNKFFPLFSFTFVAKFSIARATRRWKERRLHSKCIYFTQICRENTKHVISSIIITIYKKGRHFGAFCRMKWRCWHIKTFVNCSALSRGQILLVHNNTLVMF